MHALMFAAICSSETWASQASRAFARLTHLCFDDQPIHVDTVVASTPRFLRLLWLCAVVLPCCLTNSTDAPP